MKQAKAFVFAAAFVWATGAIAQSVTLTEKNGRPLTVGGNAAFAEGLTVTPLTTAEIVGEFERLCLPSPVGTANRVNASPLQLQSADVVFPANEKRPEIRVTSWKSPTSALYVVAGDNPAMRGLPIVIDERAYQVTGPYGPFRADGEQCNLVLRVQGFAEAKAIGEALAAKFGPAGKLVIKNTFADGHWQAGNVRINFTTPTTRIGPQPVHLSAQLVGSKSN